MQKLLAEARYYK